MHLGGRRVAPYTRVPAAASRTYEGLLAHRIIDVHTILWRGRLGRRRWGQASAVAAANTVPARPMVVATTSMRRPPTPAATTVQTFAEAHIVPVDTAPVDAVPANAASPTTVPTGPAAPGTVSPGTVSPGISSPGTTVPVAHTVPADTAPDGRVAPDSVADAFKQRSRMIPTSVQRKRRPGWHVGSGATVIDDEGRTDAVNGQGDLAFVKAYLGGRAEGEAGVEAERQVSSGCSGGEQTSRERRAVAKRRRAGSVARRQAGVGTA